MSKLIVEMEMPKCCDDCDANYDCCACGISGAAWFHNPRYKEFDPSKERLPDCPIKGVLPEEHGDLIDRNLLIERCQRQQKDDWNQNAAPYSWAYAYEQFEEDVLNQQAIIAAERKDDEQIH